MPARRRVAGSPSPGAAVARPRASLPLSRRRRATARPTSRPRAGPPGPPRGPRAGRAAAARAAASSTTANVTPSPGAQLAEARPVGRDHDRDHRVAAGRLVVREQHDGSPVRRDLDGPRRARRARRARRRRRRAAAHPRAGRRCGRSPGRRSSAWPASASRAPGPRHRACGPGSRRSGASSSEGAARPAGVRADRRRSSARRRTRRRREDVAGAQRRGPRPRRSRAPSAVPRPPRTSGTSMPPGSARYARQPVRRPVAGRVPPSKARVSPAREPDRRPGRDGPAASRRIARPEVRAGERERQRVAAPARPRPRG